MAWRNLFRRGEGKAPDEPGILDRLKAGLQKTRTMLTDGLDNVLRGHRQIEESLFEELEELLIQADVGMKTTLELVDWLREECRQQKMTDPQGVKPLLAQRMKEILGSCSAPLAEGPDQPTVYLVVGVNGTGKTTTVGKLAARCQRRGQKVLLGAADTFRAAAIEQLETWAARSGAEIVKHQAGADPAAVAHDAAQAAKARGVHTLIIDTAGRLHTKSNLMAELEKIERVLTRSLGRRPDEVLLVVDATTGQNAISQAKMFKGAVEPTGVVLTKLDGTAKGGIVLAIAAEVGLPVKLIGVGEGIDDLRDFHPELFVEAILAEGS